MVEIHFGTLLVITKVPLAVTSQEERTYRNGQTKVFSWKSAPADLPGGNNFEILGFDAPSPSEERRVNEGNRDTWAPFALEYLERLFDGDSQRHYVLRRSMEFKAKDQWALFPHPDEAKELNLVGIKGDIPLTVVTIDVNPKDASIQRLIFDTVQFKNLED